LEQAAEKLGNGRQACEKRSSKSKHADMDCTGKRLVEKSEIGTSKRTHSGKVESMGTLCFSAVYTTQTEFLWTTPRISVERHDN
jgi:hypothetical protein